MKNRSDKSKGFFVSAKIKKFQKNALGSLGNTLAPPMEVDSERSAIKGSHFLE